MRVKNILLYSMIMLAILISISGVLAITGSIGNSRMVLKLAPGESVEKYILVKNVNDEPVNVELYVTGDLQDSLVLNESNFTLESKEEKKAYFTIKATKPGTTETKVQIKFVPVEGKGAAVGLSSTVIVISDKDPEKFNQKTSDSTASNYNPRGTGNAVNEGEGVQLSPMLILILSTLVLVIILVVLFAYAYKRRQKEVVPSTTKQKKRRLSNE